MPGMRGPGVVHILASAVALLLASPDEGLYAGGSGRGRGAACGPRLASAAYFHVHEGEEKCFAESTPKHQVLTVKYRHQENPGVPCMLVFKDPSGKQVFSKRVSEEDQEHGKTAYMTQAQGSHSICVQCQGSKWFQTTALKWEMHVDVGDTELARRPAEKTELKNIERMALSTLARVEAISAENEYEKSAQVEFRDASELVNSHVVWVSVFIMLMEAALVVWQIMHLRAFFKREKLI